jgi:hypothetical protein
MQAIDKDIKLYAEFLNIYDPDKELENNVGKNYGPLIETDEQRM